MNSLINKLVLIISLIVCAWYYNSYGKDFYPFYGDAMGYYLYLPTTFIYHTHKNLTSLPEDKHFDRSVGSYMQGIKQNEPRTPKGYLIDRYTYGVAAMEMPFFFIAHGYEILTGKEANGYSLAYRTMVKISAIVYALLGLIIVFRILNFFFDKNLSLLGTLTILMGTNLFWFSLSQAGMAHVPVFFLYALLIYVTILIHRNPKTFLFIIAGLVAGLITIIRPVDIVCLLIPLLYNVYDRTTLKQKIVFLKAQYKRVILLAIVFIIPLIPQMIYWRTLAGSFIYYSYGKETFNWLHPRIFDGIFSFANGWLIYSPVMIFSILGIIFYKRIRPVAVIIFILLPLYIYIIYSWFCYNYINGLGSRPMIHLYPLLAIPLTAFIQYISRLRIYWRYIFSLVFLFFISLNISYSVQKSKDILNSEESNMTYNLHMLFRTRATYNDLVTNDVQQVQPANNSVEKISTLGCENYEDSISNHYVSDPTKKSRFIYHMIDEEEYDPKPVEIEYNKELFKDGNWLRCSGSFFCPTSYMYYQHLFTLEIARDGKDIKWFGCKIDNKMGLTGQNVDPNEITLFHRGLNTWTNVYFFIKLPKDLKNGDKIRLNVWNIGKTELYFDNLCIELYKNKD